MDYTGKNNRRKNPDLNERLLSVELVVESLKETGIRHTHQLKDAMTELGIQFRAAIERIDIIIRGDGLKQKGLVGKMTEIDALNDKFKFVMKILIFLFGAIFTMQGITMRMLSNI